MTVSLKSNFFANARGFTFQDSASCTWAFNANSNQLTATVAGAAGGTVTSVGLAEGSSTAIFAITGSPVVNAGTLTATLKTQTANLVFAGPGTGAAAQPTFRALVAGDLPAGTTPVGANPTASIGLAAVNGTAATFMRSDGAPALSQAIAPTWTAAHIFTPAGSAVGITVNGNTNAQGVKINSGANQFGQFILGNSTSAQSFGLAIEAGTTSADQALFVANQANTATFLAIFGDGHGTLGPSATSGVSWTAAGAVKCSSTFAINNGTPTAALAGFGAPVGTPTAGLTSASTLAQTAGTLAALCAYLKTIGFVAT